MNELIYLSAGKLNQFTTSPGKLPFRPNSVALKLPFAELSVGTKEGGADPLAPLLKKLQHVRNRLIDSRRSPRWFQEDGLEAGEWIQLETLMSCMSVSIGGRGLVVFAQPERDNDTTELLLHGSPGSLRPGRVEAGDFDATGASSADGMGQLLRSVTSGRHGSAPVDGVDADWAARGATALIAECRRRALGYVHVEGWARISAVLGQPRGGSAAPGAGHTVLASPLYVRHFAPEQ